MTTEPTNQTSPRLRIWQQNVNDSNIAQQAMLETVAEEDIDVVCIQEPYIDFKDLSRANAHWYPVYPSPPKRTDDKAPRSLTLINARLATDAWKHIPIPSLDVTATQFTSDQCVLIIINAYVDQDHDHTFDAIRDFMRDFPRRSDFAAEKTHFIVLGDFNRHCSVWDDPKDTHLFTNQNNKRAEVLLNIASDCDFKMALPRYIPTLQHFVTKKFSRPDNVWVSSPLMPQIDQCTTRRPQQPPNTDHFPILTQLHLGFEQSSPEPRRNYRATDWKEFREALRGELRALGEPQEYKLGELEKFKADLLLIQESLGGARERAAKSKKP